MIKIINGPRMKEKVGINKSDIFTAYSKQSPGARKTKDSLPKIKRLSSLMRMHRNNNGSGRYIKPITGGLMNILKVDFRTEPCWTG